MNSLIDLRSDTAIQPTHEMLRRLESLYFGDDLLEEDQATNLLLVKSSEMIGMESALLTPSGSMSNQISVAVFTQPGQEVLLGHASHIRNLEAGGLAANSGVQIRCTPVHQGIYDADALEASIREAQLQVAATGLISLESTYDLNAGYVPSLENLREIHSISRRYDLPIYMDGARIFNAAEALGVELADICQYVDAVQFCLNKGLGAPLGSVLVGSRRFISSARRARQRFGGGMRHTGLLAAPALLALPEWRKVSSDRIKARKIANSLSDVPHIALNNSPIQSNIVSFSVSTGKMSIDDFIEQLARRHVLVKKIGSDQVRLVAHRSVSHEDIELACSVIIETLAASSPTNFPAEG
ncbi:threonine aldolase family protein [Nesterenkonia muleiensis]|uniref:threonine aldolase family protein n=1 Tax=Nesterenkonia muleiensis TaxID=2282648 RepID=UPI000E736542|nr:GntG family PLP-dependent aldolase [Nesterenkonia muleiensis]